MDHICSINTKIYKSIGILYKSRNILHKNLLKQLYFSFIHYYLNYANIVWASTHKSKLTNIYRTQKHAIRVIFFKDRLTHTKPLFHDIKAMNVYEINVFQILSFIFKCKNKETPQIFENIYNIKDFNNNSIRCYGKLVKPFCRMKLTEFSISFRGPKLWNEIVISKLLITLDISFDAFKKYIKSTISDIDNVLDYF